MKPVPKAIKPRASSLLEYPQRQSGQQALKAAPILLPAPSISLYQKAGGARRARDRQTRQSVASLDEQVLPRQTIDLYNEP